MRQQQKREMEADLKARNKKRYKSDKLIWEATNAIHRLHATRSQSGKRAVFRYEGNGAYTVREGAGGVNWYRYQKHILKALLLPFAKECLKDRPDT